MSIQAKNMYEFLVELWPICRSITGNGVRETLRKIQQHIPIEINEVSSGTQVFDWTVPKEWNITEAFVEDESGNRIIDFANNNLHVMGYSTPIDEWMDLEELQKHIFSLEDQAEAIPYVTSYYSLKWGFCLSHTQRLTLKPGKYRACIKSNLQNGSLTYGELKIKGSSDREIFISTYVCHPSMANNELSGPVVATWLAKWLLSAPRKYSYRIIFVPETIGSITYLSKYKDVLQAKVIAGFNLSCVGDDRTYSFVASRYGNTYANNLITAVLEDDYSGFDRYSYLDRGSDERQYCAPGIDLPLVTFCRSKFGTYPEYHTSLDNLDLVSESALCDSLEVMKKIIHLAEVNGRYKINTYGEPQLGKYGLYPSTSTKKSIDLIRDQRNFIAYADGKNDLLEIRRITGLHFNEIIRFAKVLSEAKLVDRSEI